MRYECPLCHQPVSKETFDKITGIWGARKKALAAVENQRKQLKQKLALEKKKIANERKKFKKQKRKLVQRAVDQKTKIFAKQLDALKRKETKAKQEALRKIAELERKKAQIERQTQAKILRAEARAEARAKRLSEANLVKLKRDFKSDIKRQVRVARELEKEKQKKAKQSVDATLEQIRTMNKKQAGQIEIQKHRIQNLEKQLETQTTPQIEGLLQESKLTEELKKCFPDDKDGIKNTGKGGDILHPVMHNGECVGLIVYECKKVGTYQTAHVNQAARAKLTRKADFAVLVTNAMKKNTHGFFIEKGVIVIHPSGILSLARILRQQIAQVAGMKLGQEERDKAIKMILDYIEGSHFKNSMEMIVQESIDLIKELEDEKKKHEKIWGKRAQSYNKIQESAKGVQEKTSEALQAKAEKAKLPETPPVPAKKLIRKPSLIEASETASAAA